MTHVQRAIAWFLVTCITLSQSASLGSSKYGATPGHTGIGGLMFDVKALRDTTVTKLQFAYNGGFESTQEYTLYALKDGGAHTAQNMFTKDLWKVVASGSTDFTSDDGATTSTFEVSIPAGATEAFYIHGDSRGLIAQEHDEGPGIYIEDANIQIMVGRGLHSEGLPFATGYGEGYYVNPNLITVTYSTGVQEQATLEPTLSTSALVTSSETTAVSATLTSAVPTESSGNGVDGSLGSSKYGATPGHTGIGGLMFDVKALRDTTVTKLQFAYNGGFESTQEYTLYALKDGGAHTTQNMFTKDLWKVVASGSTEFTSDNGATTSTFEVSIPAGATEAFYIHGDSRDLIAQKHNGPGIYIEDANIQIMVGRGLHSEGLPFATTEKDITSIPSSSRCRTQQGW